MKRDLDALQSARFDVLVVGGGVHGACVARDAALRGLSVALIEQSDFASATSHNSLKTIHGGIRYLQHLNIKRTVESLKEQDIFLNTMPHLVQPLRFLMPCYGWRMRGPLVSGIGVVLFEIIGFITSLFTRGVARRSWIGGILSAKQALNIAPGLDRNNLTGAIVWRDAQVSLADKAVLQMLRQASENGAIIANRVQAISLALNPEKRLASGVLAKDVVTGNTFMINAIQTINATGPWVDKWITEHVTEPESAQQDSLKQELSVGLVKSMNLLLRIPAPPMAFGIKSQLKSDSKIDNANRLFFAIPWQGQTLIGTTHFTYIGNARELALNESEIKRFVDEFKQVYPAMDISLDDVLYCYQGLTPGDDAVDSEGAKLHHSKVVDHQLENDLSGVVSIISIKWTTARLVAEQTVDILTHKLRLGKQCASRIKKLPDYADIAHETNALSEQKLQEFVMAHIQGTQAARLTDIVLRRTNDFLLGSMSPQRVRLILNVLSTHFVWSEAVQRSELESLLDSGLGPGLRKSLLKEFKEELA